MKQRNWERKKHFYKKEQRKYFTVQIALIILLLTSLMSFIMWQNIEGLNLNKKLKVLTKEYISLQKLYYEKEIEYTKLKAENKIIKKGKSLLNMIPTKRVDFLELGIEDKKLLNKEFRKNKKEIDIKQDRERE